MTLGPHVSRFLAPVLTAVADQVAMTPRPPSSFWPDNIVAYLAAIGSTVALFGAYRRSQKETVEPVEKKLTEKIEETHERIAETRALFGGELARAERQLDNRVEEIAAQTEYQFNGFRESLTRELNGWGLRVAALERGSEMQDGINDRLLEHMAESRTDRAALGKQMEAMSRAVDEMRREHGAATQRLLDAILKRGHSA